MTNEAINDIYDQRLDKLLRASGDEVAALEQWCDITQQELVDGMIEATCWREHPLVAPFIGHRGSNAERRDALLAAFAAQEAEEAGSKPDVGFKRFMLFTVGFGNPHGGVADCMDSFDTLDEAIALHEATVETWSLKETLGNHILDLDERRVVWRAQ